MKLTKEITAWWNSLTPCEAVSNMSFISKMVKEYSFPGGPEVEKTVSMTTIAVQSFILLNPKLN